MKNPWIFPAAALAIGAVGGYISGKNTSTDSGGNPSTSGKTVLRTRSSSRSDNPAAEQSGKHSNRPTGTEEISRMPGNSGRIKALMEFYENLTPDQLAEEARKLDSLPMNERIMASILLFGRWAEKDPTAAMAYSNSIGFTGMFVRPTILQSWASVDPANAANYYASNPREFAMMGMMGGGRGPMGGGQSGASIIASEWARQDPAAAMAWANSLTTTNDKNHAMESVIGEVAKTDPQKAVAMLVAMDSTDKGDAYRSVAAQYGAANFSEAQAWIRTLPADDQAAALASAIGGLSNKDPQAAAKQVGLMEAGDAKNGVITSVVEDLARMDPKAAAVFLKQQDSEKAQRDAMRQLMPAWVAQDPSAALAYANSYEAGDVRDSALQSYVFSNNSVAPAELLKVAETITDEGDRSRSVGIAAARWMREDATAAKAYIQQATSIPEDAKTRIIEGRSMFGGGGRGQRGGNTPAAPAGGTN
jgi:hypothetical protein